MTYHPNDFRRIKGKQLGGLVDFDLVKKIERIAEVRKTTNSVEFRRALREYAEGEYPKLDAELAVLAEEEQAA